ncbi:F-box/LRR-repeat protein 25-like [Aristolochia californica]|uniref:F-box/LRR-repeat protein 25-like n=1 Tax=Aristolochia californica TaxID=171875 RepID=UPI0035D89635
MYFQHKRIFTQKKDSITKLPENIIHHIPSFLPLKCAMKTSILSRQWINMWKALWIYTTIIDFDDEFTNNLKKTHYVQVVYQLLQLHTLDKVKKFHMFFSPGDIYSYIFIYDLREWIEFVKVRFGELMLDLNGNVRHSNSTNDDDIRWGMNKFRMPNSLFSCLSISSFDLTWCILEPPHDLKGYKALRSVALYGVTINGVQLGEIILGSPLLEDLTINYCDSLKSIKIDHLQLKRLTLESCFDIEEMDIRTPNLKNLQYKGQVCEKPIFIDVSSINEATLLLNHDELDYKLHLWQNFLTKLLHVSSLEVKVTSTHPIRFHLPISVFGHVTTFFYLFGVDQAKMSKLFSYTSLSFFSLKKKIYIQISRYNDITECHVTKMTSEEKASEIMRKKAHNSIHRPKHMLTKTYGIVILCTYVADSSVLSAMKTVDAPTF